MPLTTIGTASIDALAITTAKLAADAVTAAKIATDAVDTAEIAADAVGASEIAADAVGASELADDAVDTDAVADNAVTLAKIADGTQGGTIYYGASGAPTELAAGTSGKFLKTQGAGANPTWDTVTTTALTGSTNTWIPTITGANALTGTANFTYDGSILDVKNGGTASSIKLYCESSNAHAQEIKAAPHASSSSWTLTLPGVVPTASGQFLSATTAGVASWAAANPNAFQVSLASDVALADDVNVKVLWDTEQFDVGGNFASNKFTVPSGGDGNYLFYAQGTIDGIGQDNIQTAAIKLYKNGSAVAVSTNQLPQESDIMMYVSMGISLVATDYVEVYAALNSVNGVAGRIGGGTSALFWGFKLG